MVYFLDPSAIVNYIRSSDRATCPLLNVALPFTHINGYIWMDTWTKWCTQWIGHFIFSWDFVDFNGFVVHLQQLRRFLVKIIAYTSALKHILVSDVASYWRKLQGMCMMRKWGVTLLQDLSRKCRHRTRWFWLFVRSAPYVWPALQWPEMSICFYLTWLMSWWCSKEHIIQGFNKENKAIVMHWK